MHTPAVLPVRGRPDRLRWYHERFARGRHGGDYRTPVADIVGVAFRDVHIQDPHARREVRRRFTGNEERGERRLINARSTTFDNISCYTARGI